MKQLKRNVISLSLASSAVALAGLAGCVDTVTSETRTIAPEPQSTVTYAGAATQPVREFDQTTAVYQNGDIASSSTANRYTVSDKVNTLAIPAAETVVFLTNTVTAPVTAYQQRDGIVSTGPQIPPTHTAMPPLPASQAQMREALPVAPSTQPTEMQIVTGDPAAPAVVTTTAGLTPAAELSTTAFAIVGHVQFPGRYEAQENLTLAQALVAAGLVEQDGNKVSVKIERAGEEPSSATLAEILSGQTANPVLVAGDVVTVTVK